ncbi:MAG: hypothetical protein A2939_00010 [Parcubacteria group bacterium RIFCSPLOWO2_01_FULL_48_18]|nr:MAG: hypothetical protein A2939_00010 [Parcubacteria group bacterium RIFCSPLOWO2_01_FULL_48_18]
MYSLISQITLFVSFGVIIYLFIKAVPRITDEEIQTLEQQMGKNDRIAEFFHRLPLEKIDAWLSKTLEKAVRKAKVAVLKIDNRLTALLTKVRATPAGSNGNGGGGNRTELFSTRADTKESKSE